MAQKKTKKDEQDVVVEVRREPTEAEKIIEGLRQRVVEFQLRPDVTAKFHEDLDRLLKHG